VIDTCKALEKDGYRVTYLPVAKDGRISLDALKAAITDKTILISIMAANNEIGVLQPIAEIGAIAKEKGVLFHTDAVQIVGKVPFNVNDLKVDMASISAHKMYGPKALARCTSGAGTRRVLLSPIIDGRRSRARHALGDAQRHRDSSASGSGGVVPAGDGDRGRAAAQATRIRLNDKLHRQLDEL